MPSDLEFRELLLNLEDDMTNEERKKFVFLLGDDIPKRKREEPLVEIFSILIDRGRISEMDCSYLVQMFERMKLLTAAYKIAHFEAQRSPLLPTLSENNQPTEGVHFPDIVSRESGHNNQTLTTTELLNEFYATDAMIMPDSEQNSPFNTPVIIEPTPPAISFFLENIDLKVFASDSWSDEFLENINVKNIRPYEYQRELVQHAVLVGNTIICLRAGGGKTFVAALLLKYYMIKKMTLSNGKKFLAFFIVPRRAMLKQQLQTLRQIGNLQVIVCDENCDPTQYINNHDIIVCTPQKLLNCLQAKTIFLSNIDLLCFDECHDSMIRNQYIGIMQYLMCKTVDRIPPVDSAPVIIGLTAIGVHHSTPSHIIQSLVILCATFNCLNITTVLNKENEEELERCVTRVSEDEIVCVEKSKEYELLRLSVEKELKNLILQLFVNKETNPLRIFPEKDLGTNGYEQNLELLKQSEQKNQHFASALLLNYTLVIYRHLQALMHLTPVMILSDLRDYFETSYKSREHPHTIDKLIYEQCRSVFRKNLTEIEDSTNVLINPKLEKLVQLLKKHAENSKSRALVLVERTFYAKKICEFLQNHPDLQNLIKPCWLVSQNGVSSGQLKKSQTTILEEFQTGVYNVMISTDIVQAGLNIPQCSLVLRYDFVPDSIGNVQARVRARAIDCKYYLITTKDSPNYFKERDSRQCEQDLKEVLEVWKGISADEFQRRVVDTQTSLVTKWTESFIKAAAPQTNISKTTELTGDVLCRACGYMLGQLTQVRQYGQAYFLSDHEFYNRIVEQLLDEPEHYVTSSVIGKALCGNKTCHAKLGCIQVLNDHPEISPIYPLKCESIKIKQIDNESGKENIILKKKWSKMPFKIPLFRENSSTNDNDDIFYDACDTFPSDL